MKKTLSQTNKDLDLRRFGKDVYTKASQGEGGGGITADDITPELLENKEVLAKIRNWGLSDEEISHLHVLHGIEKEFQNSIYADEDLTVCGKFSRLFLDGNGFDTQTQDYKHLFDDMRTLEEYKYLVYSIYGNFDGGGIVLKRNSFNNQLFESVDFGVNISITDEQYCLISIGADTM